MLREHIRNGIINSLIHLHRLLSAERQCPIPHGIYDPFAKLELIVFLYVRMLNKLRIYLHVRVHGNYIMPYLFKEILFSLYNKTSGHVPPLHYLEPGKTGL